MIYDILVNHGLPINSEAKDDYGFIKNELQRMQKQTIAVNGVKIEKVKEERKNDIGEKTDILEGAPTTADKSGVSGNNTGTIP